jgi:hypothetical protein
MRLLEYNELSGSAAGEHVLVGEPNDGEVVIEFRGPALPARRFIKDAREPGSHRGHEFLGRLRPERTLIGTSDGLRLAARRCIRGGLFRPAATRIPDAVVFLDCSNAAAF